MGLEIGWHLRFTRAHTLEILVRPSLAGALQEEAAISGCWDLEVRPAQGHVLGVYIRLGKVR